MAGRIKPLRTGITECDELIDAIERTQWSLQNINVTHEHGRGPLGLVTAQVDLLLHPVSMTRVVEEKRDDKVIDEKVTLRAAQRPRCPRCGKEGEFGANNIVSKLVDGEYLIQVEICNSCVGELARKVVPSATHLIEGEKS